MNNTTPKKPRVAGTRPKKKKEIRSSLSNVYGAIKESHFNRYISHDLYQYKKYVAGGGAALYSESEIDDLVKAGVSDRLPPRATAYYMDLASRSEGIRNLIKARPEETQDLSGERDPSNQLRYSPVAGLLHKYELVLLYVVRACSSWCRYCYRSDFLTGKTEKDIGSIQEITDYIKNHNAKAAAHNKPGMAIRDKILPIREALLSGGDPMVLSNKNLFDYMNGLASAGVKMVRIGTKELAFFPQRFDENFFAMLDLFHELHPRVGLAFMVHFSHPDEFLERSKETGEYIVGPDGGFKRIEVTENAIIKLRGRHYVTLENQTPIIDSVNDNPETLNLMQRELKRLGVNNHYYFQCREIEGHKAFAVPVEKAWDIHRQSQVGLSGIEKSRFAMSTEFGKLEFISVIDKPDFARMGVNIPEAFQQFVDELLGDGLVVLKVHRTPYADFQGDLVIARRNPEALWITGYEDRIIYDGRKEGDEKYSPLAKFLKPFIEGFEDKIPEFVERIAIPA
jgi:lysine 2,3-aminomutase